MPRRFTNAREMLTDLLDRFEAGTESPIAYPDYGAFASVVAADTFMREIGRAEQAGAVSVRRGRGSKRDEIVHIRLTAPDILYRILDRTPVSKIAEEAGARLVAGLALDPGLNDAALKITAGWARAKAWNAFSPDDVDKLRGAFVLAQAILEGRHVDVDYRTFSRKIAGDSKALERVEGAVVRLLDGILELPPDAKPREALRTLGLERFAPPLLIAGRVDLANTDMSRASLLYLGISPSEADRIRFCEPPAYLLTVENFASFNRHIIEADPSRLGTTLFVGGYPSLATQKALRTLTDAAPKNTPFYHWSDIDPDGTWIFHTIERSVGRFIRPHLMNLEIAERLGKVPAAKSAPARCPAGSGIYELSQYLATEGAKTLEQEELDPVLPQVLFATA
jgi:hypothetical protein